MSKDVSAVKVLSVQLYSGGGSAKPRFMTGEGSSRGVGKGAKGSSASVMGVLRTGDPTEEILLSLRGVDETREGVRGDDGT